MGIKFNVDEIFEMAEEIERNGAGFYRRAAKTADDPQRRDLLLDLAAKEDEHEKIFQGMRAQLKDEERAPTVFDPDDEGPAYLKAIADTEVFKPDPMKVITGSGPTSEILTTAIGLEKDSIVFYLGLKEMVPERLGKDKVDIIIKEEMRHITILSQYLISFD